jgi:hypothetical protein
MSSNALCSEVLATSGFTDGRNAAALVGTTTSFVPDIGAIGTLTVSISRKPAGSSASVSSNAITWDVPGFYAISQTNANQTRIRNVVVFPASTTSLRVQASNPNSATVSLQHMTGAANDNCSQATCTSSLELATPSLVGLTGLAGAPAWQMYGA